MSFVYDRFYNYTENYQDAEETIPQSGQSKFGFEFITDNSGMGEWEMVAFAKYRVDIFSNLSEIPEIPKFTFFIDFKTCTESFYDIDIIIKRITSNEYEFYCRRSNLSSGGLLTPYQNILYWELAGLVHSNSCFYYDNYVRNKINKQEAINNKQEEMSLSIRIHTGTSDRRKCGNLVSSVKRLFRFSQ